jgi:hypothetical protein
VLDLAADGTGTKCSFVVVKSFFRHGMGPFVCRGNGGFEKGGDIVDFTCRFYHAVFFSFLGVIHSVSSLCFNF